ncbi:hypothetical protein [Williamsia sp. 1135]|uniref:hypothetical protein n=1 Tax=Williamsia sp. 1135 TaxID=1889262 RepID=UPI00117F2DAF|nr:hypothetical protein [Williamsia sp. 1135]
MTGGSKMLRSRSMWSRARLIAVALCGLFVAMTVSVAMAGTACACSCVGFTAEEAASRADAVFTARAKDKVTAGMNDIYEFEVSEVFKGEVGNVTTVGTPSQGPSCGVSYEVGGEYLLFVSTPDDVDAAWGSNLCLGPTGQADTRAVLEREYGPPQPPAGWAPDVGITGSTESKDAIPVALVAVGSVVAVGAVWWAAVTIRRRRRAGE